MTAAHAITEFASIDFRRAPGELGFVRTRDDVRGVLLHELLAGRAVWLSSEGMSFARPRSHSRLLRATSLFRRGLAGLAGNPHTAVLDWSTTRAPGIEAFAMFPIVTRVVGSYGATVICCEPRDPYVAGLLVESGFAEDATFRWVSEEQQVSLTVLRHVHAERLASVRYSFRIVSQPRLATPQALRLVAPVVVRSSDPECADEFGDIYEAAGDWAAARGASEDVAGVVTGLARELVANAVIRAHASVVSIALGVSNGFVPRLEFAVADDGIGIAAEIRRKLGVGLVDRIPERHFIADLVRGVHNARAAEIGCGRGLVFGLRELFAAADALVQLRSGGVMVTLTRDGSSLSVLSSSTVGLGTVVRVSVPLRY